MSESPSKMRGPELMRSLRAAGPGALAELKKLKLDKLTPADVAELKAMLPQLKEAFGPEVAKALLELLAGGGTAEAPELDALLPDLKDLEQAKELPGRFSKDLRLVRPLLVEHPALSRQEKATRLFSFLGPFAEKLATFAKGQEPKAPPRAWGAPRPKAPEAPPKPPLPEAERRAVARQLTAELGRVGFQELKDTRTGESGLDAAKALLETKSPAEVREAMKQASFDAPAWPSDAKATTPQPGQPGPTGQAQRSPSQPELAPAQEEELKRRRGKLSGRMLWNVMHLFRDDGKDDRESAAQREEMNRLAVGMLLALGLLTLIGLIAALV